MSEPREITAIDHVNQHMLNAFKSHVESGNVKVFDYKEEDSGEWDDKGNELIVEEFILDYKHEDDLPTQDVIIGDKEKQEEPQQAPSEPTEE
jgi:hypothetical protein